jgi:DNA-directed RNA polymerase subunit H
MQNISSTVTSLYTARGVLLAQLGHQGYDTDSYTGFGINEVNIMFTNSTLDMIMEKRESKHETREKVYVRYFQGKTVRSSSSIRELVDDLLLNETIQKTDTIIFITMEDGNDTIREFVKQLWAEENIFVIPMSVKRLQFNVLEHEIVPKHTIISSEEVEEIMRKYKMRDLSLFPEISRYDPVAVSLGMRPGDVCKIERPSKTIVVSDYYRICVNN